MKYRICWRSRTDKYEGHGEPVLDSHERASLIAESLRNKLPFMEYWVEAIADDQDDQEDKD